MALADLERAQWGECWDRCNIWVIIWCIALTFFKTAVAPLPSFTFGRVQ
jgi:hypothetical protein